MTPSLSQEVSPASVPNDPTVKPITAQIHERFARFRDRHPNSSLTALLESGPTLSAAGVPEYIVRATISLEGQPLVSSLAAAPSVEEAEDRARLRNLALAEAALAPRAQPSAMPAYSPAPQQTASWAAPSLAPAFVPAEFVPTQSSSSGGNDALDDGLGETLINLGSQADLETDPETDHKAAPQGIQAPSHQPKAKPKPKSKSKPAQSTTAGASGSSATAQQPGDSQVQGEDEAAPQAPVAASSQEFVADWSEDLAQIAVELKRLNWDSKQEQAYLQHNFNKASRDDIIDHSELLDYLGYLQALPSHFEAKADDDSPIADGGLSMDEADLQPQSITELMANAGLKPASAIPAPPAIPKQQASESAIATADSSPQATPEPNPDPNVITREPVPEAELTYEEPDEPESPGPEELELEPELDPEQTTQLPSDSLSRSEMMEETARLCKQLGWKNRQGSDFLQATYGKATRNDLTDGEMMDFLEQLRSLSTTEALPY